MFILADVISSKCSFWQVCFQASVHSGWCNFWQVWFMVNANSGKCYSGRWFSGKCFSARYKDTHKTTRNRKHDFIRNNIFLKLTFIYNNYEWPFKFAGKGILSHITRWNIFRHLAFLSGFVFYAELSRRFSGPKSEVTWHIAAKFRTNKSRINFKQLSKFHVTRPNLSHNSNC